MAEWVTHVLVGYALFTALGWVVEWLDPEWIVVGIVGSILPDFDRLGLVLPSEFISELTGLPFGWGGVQSVAGIVLLSAIGALLFGERTHQQRAFGLLLAGALAHLLVDLPQRYVDGRMLTQDYLFPLPPVRPPTPGWYVSADRWVAVVALAVALTVYLVDRYRTPTGTGTTTVTEAE